MKIQTYFVLEIGMFINWFATERNICVAVGPIPLTAERIET